MNFSTIFSTAAIVISLSTASVFGVYDISTSIESTPKIGAVVTEVNQSDVKDWKQKCKEFDKDPIKALQNRKEKIQSLLKDGKITKEKADKMTARIDSKIKEIQDFNKLTLPQKKDKLINDFKASVEKRVKEGKIDKAKADTLVKEFIEKINKWDGNGYPKFHQKWHKYKCKNHGNNNR